MAPWMLCALEVVAVLLIYFLATSRSLVVHQVPRHYRFSYRHSLEDVVGMSCTRAALLSLAYAIGQRSAHRPYLYAAYLLAAACFPYIVVKTILFRFGRDGIAAAAILVLTGLSTWVHIFAARRTVEWARRRYSMGLGGFGMPWEEGEEAWLVLRRPDLEELTKTSDGGGPETGGEDIPPEMLADDDSKFVELGPGLKLHYKEVTPPMAAGLGMQAGGSSSGGAACEVEGCGTTGILLVHGFGGGVFAWRHVMEALALQCHCRVVAFDRPAFGLTTRPKATDHFNPYTVSAQSQLLLQLCSALGLRRVVLIAHADGCLVTLRAAAMSASHYHHQAGYHHPQPHAPPQHPASVSQPLPLTAGVMRGAELHPQHLHHAHTAPASSSGSSPKARGGSLPASPPAEPQQLGMGSAASRGGPSSPAMGAAGAVSAAAMAAASAPAELSAAASHGLQQVVGGGRAQERTVEGGSGRNANMCIPALSSAGRPPMPPSSSSGSLALHHAPYTSGAGLGGARTMSPPNSVVDVEVGSMRVETSMEMERSVVSLTGTPQLAVSTGVSNTAIAGMSGSVHRRVNSTSAAAGAGGGLSVSGGGAAGVGARPSDGWEAASVMSTGGGAGALDAGSFCGAPAVMPVVLGLGLLHPNLSGHLGPAFSRILARSKLGRSILRPLLRTEVGEVANRRAWHNTDKLTTEVLELYKTPLRVEGWDSALIETTRQRREACQGDLVAYCDIVQSVPTLIATGEHDRIVPPAKSDALASDLRAARLSVLLDCGHLSHEEAPGALLEQLVPFCGEVLCGPGSGPRDAHVLGFGRCC